VSEPLHFTNCINIDQADILNNKNFTSLFETLENKNNKPKRLPSRRIK